MELYIPADWQVRIECSCFCGRCEDKRWQGTPAKQAFLSTSCSVFLPGQLSFCGIICRLWQTLHYKQKISPPPRQKKAAPLPHEESIDRITVKDGSRIHIIKVEDLLYIQACGDYATLVTSDGEYIKEQTMKNFETHLPADNFVRIHRSSIVNVTQISRVEQYGKETYQVTLKSGVKLRVSLSRYRLLKERLGI